MLNSLTASVAHVDVNRTMFVTVEEDSVAVLFEDPRHTSTLVLPAVETRAFSPNNVAFSHPIQVQESNPALAISVKNGQLVLTWPAAAGGFELMVSSDLSSALNWVPAGLIPTDREILAETQEFSG